MKIVVPDDFSPALTGSVAEAPLQKLGQVRVFSEDQLVVFKHAWGSAARHGIAGLQTGCTPRSAAFRISADRPSAPRTLAIGVVHETPWAEACRAIPTRGLLLQQLRLDGEREGEYDAT